MGQCQLQGRGRYEVSGPDGRMGNDGKCSVPTLRTCFCSGGVVTTTLHYNKKYFFFTSGRVWGGGWLGGGGGGDIRLDIR